MDKFIEKVAEETKDDEMSIDTRELMIKFDRLTEAVRVNAQITGDTVTALNTMGTALQKIEVIVSSVLDLASIQAFRDGDTMMAVMLREALKK